MPPKPKITVALFAHGYASIIASNHLEYDEKLIRSTWNAPGTARSSRRSLPRMTDKERIRGRIDVPSLDQLPLLLFTQIVSVLGEEIEFRAFFVGKGMKLFPFWPSATAAATPV